MLREIRPDYDDCEAAYANPGGTASIVGSVFGLPEGSTLFTASFFGGASSYSEVSPDTVLDLAGSVNISYVNPVLLANLGMAGLRNYGTGTLSDSFDSLYPDYQHVFNISVTFTTGPIAFNLLHSFTGGTDGGFPYAGVTMDKAGKLYGTTSSGGTGNGTAFRLSYRGSGWVFTPVYSFQGGSDGSSPEAKVTLGPDGALYGTTYEGGGSGCGGSGCGTIFSLRPSSRACKAALCPWTETVLYSFSGGPDGANPLAEVIFDQAGNLYGTTAAGGLGGGTVFELIHRGSGWTKQVLYNFMGGTDGRYPAAGLIFDQMGNLWGTTVNGGSLGQCGTV
jgi:hypothetical protein